jgi:hypothetical protein
MTSQSCFNKKVEKGEIESLQMMRANGYHIVDKFSDKREQSCAEMGQRQSAAS